MQLDKTKKYEFCGEVYGWSDGMWRGGGLGWISFEFQLFADHGHVKEVRDPLVFEGEVTFDNAGGDKACNSAYLLIPFEDRKGKTFKVTWTEVVK